MSVSARVSAGVCNSVRFGVACTDRYVCVHVRMCPVCENVRVCVCVRVTLCVHIQGCVSVCVFRVCA